MVCRAPRTAASIAGKISSPFSRFCDPVAVEHRRPEQRAQLAPKLRIVGGVAMLDLALDAPLGLHKIQSDDRERNCQHCAE